MLKYEKHTEIEISDEDLREIIDNAFRFNMGDKETNIRYALSHYRVAKAISWDVDQIQLFVDKLDDIVKDIASTMKKKWVNPDIMELSLTPIKSKNKVKHPCDGCRHNTENSVCVRCYKCEECSFKCREYLNYEAGK